MLFSADPGQTALDFAPEENSSNSAYTTVLLRLLKEQGLTHVDISKRLRTEVAVIAKRYIDPETGKPHEQKPGLLGSG